MSLYLWRAKEVRFSCLLSVFRSFFLFSLISKDQCFCGCMHYSFITEPYIHLASASSLCCVCVCVSDIFSLTKMKLVLQIEQRSQRSLLIRGTSRDRFWLYCPWWFNFSVVGSFQQFASWSQRSPNGHQQIPAHHHRRTLLARHCHPGTLVRHEISHPPES